MQKTTAVPLYQKENQGYEIVKIQDHEILQMSFTVQVPMVAMDVVKADFNEDRIPSDQVLTIIKGIVQGTNEKFTNHFLDVVHELSCKNPDCKRGKIPHPSANAHLH